MHYTVEELSQTYSLDRKTIMTAIWSGTLAVERSGEHGWEIHGEHFHRWLETSSSSSNSAADIAEVRGANPPPANGSGRGSVLLVERANPVGSAATLYAVLVVKTRGGLVGFDRDPQSDIVPGLLHLAQDCLGRERAIRAIFWDGSEFWGQVVEIGETELIFENLAVRLIVPRGTLAAIEF